MLTPTFEQVVHASSLALGTLPSTYPDVTLCRTLTTLQNLTAASLDVFANTVDTTTGLFPNTAYWQSGNAWTTLAQYDMEASSKRYETSLSNSFNIAGSGTFGFANNYNDDTLWWALANIQAYYTYGNAVYLEAAESLYDWVYDNGLILPSDIPANSQTGHVPFKEPNVTFSSTCFGASMVGGVYWRSEPTDPGINAVSTGLFASLAAELAFIHSNSTYAKQAAISLEWIDNMLLQPNGLVADHIDGACTLTDWLFTYNQGLYIRAYARLGSLSFAPNATQMAKATTAAYYAMNTTLWNNAQGLITEDTGPTLGDDDGIGFKSVMIRALSGLHTLTQDAQVQADILRYINLQYYALTQLDSDSTTNPIHYGRNWTGPTYDTWTDISQIAAADVLNAVLLNTNFPLTDSTGPIICIGGSPCSQA